MPKLTTKIDLSIEREPVRRAAVEIGTAAAALGGVAVALGAEAETVAACVGSVVPAVILFARVRAFVTPTGK